MNGPPAERQLSLDTNLSRIRGFRGQFADFEQLRLAIAATLPTLVGKLYADCQGFATQEIDSLLEVFVAQIGRA